MKTKTHFAFRLDIWDDIGDSIVEHVAGVDDFEVPEATYRAAVRAGQRRAHRNVAMCQSRLGHRSRKKRAVPAVASTLPSRLSSLSCSSARGAAYFEMCNWKDRYR
jgi:hypothetical protein